MSSSRSICCRSPRSFREWEEASKRKRAWLTPADAAKLIDEPQLAGLVQGLAEGDQSKLF